MLPEPTETGTEGVWQRPAPAIRGTGDFLYEHTYAPDMTSATAPDGTVTGDVQTVELDPVSPTTTLVALGATTTLAVSTTTTEPPATTMTTTEPAPEPVTVVLAIGGGKIASQWGEGIQEYTWNGSMATAEAVRHKDE